MPYFAKSLFGFSSNRFYVINGEQKIFVWCDFSPEMDDVIAHGLKVASILGKELCLFHLIKMKRNEDFGIAEAKLCGIFDKIQKTSAQVKLHYLVVKESLSGLLTDLAELYDCILLVAHKKAASTILPDLKYSGFPFLFISSDKEMDKIYKEIIVPVGSYEEKQGSCTLGKLSGAAQWSQDKYLYGFGVFP